MAKMKLALAASTCLALLFIIGLTALAMRYRIILTTHHDTLDALVASQDALAASEHILRGLEISLDEMWMIVNYSNNETARALDLVSTLQNELAEAVAIRDMPCRAPTLPTTHRITTGDTLSNLAMRYFGRADADVIEHIVQDNPHIVNHDIVLRVGVDLELAPMDGMWASAVIPPDVPHATFAPILSVIHRVEIGDSLPSIAMRYFGRADAGVIEHILEKNPIVIDPSALHVGWYLEIVPMVGE